MELREQSLDTLAETVMGAASWAENGGDHESYNSALVALAELVRRASLAPREHEAEHRQ